MAEIDDHKPAEKPGSKPVEAHDFHDAPKSSAPEKTEEHHSDDTHHHEDCAEKLSTAVPLHEQLKFFAHKAEAHDKDKMGAGKEILGLSPLDLSVAKTGDARLEANKERSVALLDPKFKFEGLDTAPGMAGFMNTSLDQKSTHLFSGAFANCSFADPFGADRTRSVTDFDSFSLLPKSGVFESGQIANMKFDVGAEGASLWSDLKLITSGALMLGADRSANPAAPVGKSDVDLASGAMSLFFKNASTDLSKDQNSSFWNRAVSAVESFGSKLVEGAKDLIAGTTVASVDFSALGIGNREVHNAPGGKVETFANANIKAFDTGHDKIVQSRDADGKPHEVSVKTDDGRELSQTRDGVRKATSSESDLTILQDPKTGKVQALDRSGAKVQEFDSKGTAIRFLESADKLVVQPGQTLEQAYLAYTKEPGNAERQKAHPVILMDGKGESMTVQPDGSRIYTHANGESTSVYKHLGPDGKPHDIKVNISKGPDGKEILTIESEHGKKLQISSEEAKAMMQNSRLKLDDQGQLMVNNDLSGDARRARWHRMIEQHRLNLGENANVDLRTHTVTVDDANTHTVTTVDKSTGTVVESDFNRRPDGKFDDKPSRVTTIDNAGHATIQGMDPVTGEKRPGDVVTVDSNKHSVDAFNIEMNNKDAVIKHPDGSTTTINRQGDIDARDGQGRDIVKTNGDKVSYDGGSTYERYSSSGKGYTEEQAQKVTAAATAAAINVMAGAAALLSAIDVSAGQVDALASELSAALSQCASLGLPVPPQVAAAQATISTLMAKVGVHNELNSSLSALAGQGGNKTLEKEASAMSGSADERARTTLKNHGLLSDDKNH